VCGRASTFCNAGSAPLGNGGGVQTAVDVRVELVVVDIVLRVEVNEIVFVTVLYVGGGITKEVM